MTFKKLSLVAIGALIAISSVGFTNQNVFADHTFETGIVPGSTLQPTVHVPLAGTVMRPGDYLPVADFSPQFVTGHFLLAVPCDSRGIPAVIPIGGHIDEHDHETWVDQLQMNYIAHASTPGKTCVYHSHVPAIELKHSTVAWAGPPRITDMGLFNISGKNVVFRTGNVAMFTMLTEVNTITPPNGYGLPSSVANGGWAFGKYLDTDMDNSGTSGGRGHLPGDIYNRNLVEPIDDPTGFLPTGAVSAR